MKREDDSKCPSTTEESSYEGTKIISKKEYGSRLDYYGTTEKDQCTDFTILSTLALRKI